MADSIDKFHIRNLLVFYFRKSKTAVKAAEKINQVYPGAIGPRDAQHWFKRFRDGNFKLEDAPRSGRPEVVDSKELLKIIEADPRLTTRELEAILGCDHSTVARHLHKIGKVNKLGKWVPHELTSDQKLARVTICNSLLRKNETEPFLDKLITGDEKWVLYVNVQRKGQWLSKGQKPQSTAKPGLHPQKVLLCIWWDRNGVIYYELLDEGQTITAKLYCDQLDRLHKAIKDRRPALANRKGVTFHHDNARPHSAKITKDKLRKFGWDIIPQPAYSPDLAASDFHLFRSLQNFLNGKSFADKQAVKVALDDFFESKSPEFYRKGIDALPMRWETVVDNDGEYISD